MNGDKIAKQFAELPEPTRKFLTDLTVEDAKALEAGMPLVRALIGFAKVSKWIIITILGILGGVVLFGESVMKIAAWFKAAADMNHFSRHGFVGISLCG